jgi:lipoate-protein ligase A
MRDSWYLLDSRAEEPALNMAWDHALLEHCGALGRPVLRLYAWMAPAATFGYFQRHADVARLTPLRPLIRRPTGGGLVPHDADWTYAIAVPTAHSWYDLSAVDSYRRIHEWLRRSLGRIGIETILAPCCDATGPGQCFLGAEKFDLLHRGRKIAGAAQRRNRSGLLIQGSVRPPPGSSRADWQAALVDEARPVGTEWSPLAVPGPVRERALELRAALYASDDHTRRR